MLGGEKGDTTGQWSSLKIALAIRTLTDSSVSKFCQWKLTDVLPGFTRLPDKWTGKYKPVISDV